MTKDITRRALFQVAVGAAMVGPMRAGPLMAGQHHLSKAGSHIDPTAVQFLFADLQVALVATSQTTTPAGLSRAVGVLAKIASIIKAPILVSYVPLAKGSARIIPELEPFANPSNMIERTPVSPFGHLPTVAALKANKRKTLVVAGFASEVVVRDACLDAIAAGYDVYYVVDASGGKTERTEAAAFREIELAGGKPISVLTLATSLVHDFIRSPGPEVYAALAPVLNVQN